MARIKNSSKHYSNAINEIYSNLDNDMIYATWHEDYRFPMYWGVLKKDLSRSGKPILAWNNYGSSAEDFTRQDLKWLIETIFKTTPEQFIKQYECVSRFDYNHCIHNGKDYSKVDNGYKAAFYNMGE